MIADSRELAVFLELNAVLKPDSIYFSKHLSEDIILGFGSSVALVSDIHRRLSRTLQKRFVLSYLPLITPKFYLPIINFQRDVYDSDIIDACNRFKKMLDDGNFTGLLSTTSRIFVCADSIYELKASAVRLCSYVSKKSSEMRQREEMISKMSEQIKPILEIHDHLRNGGKYLKI